MLKKNLKSIMNIDKEVIEIEIDDDLAIIQHITLDDEVIIEIKLKKGGDYGANEAP